MYLRYFGLSEKPFNITPDSYFLYLSPTLQDILSELTLGINDRCGLIGLVGEEGSGKTTFINALLERLDKKTKTALLFNFSKGVPFEQILAAALVDFGLAKPDESYSVLEAIQKFHEYALQQLISGGNVLLIMDEAQVLDPACLENLRLLSNLETRKNKLVQILLVATPRLKESVAKKEFSEFNDRITKWCHIGPLKQKEVQSYIAHRLSVAGDDGKLKFTKRAVRSVFKYSQGNPRSINLLCHRALVVAYCKDKFVVDRKMIEAAHGDLHQTVWRKKPKKIAPFVAKVAPLAAGLVIGLGVASLGKDFIEERFLSLFSGKGVEAPVHKSVSVSTYLPSQYIRKPIDQWSQRAATGKTEEIKKEFQLDVSLLFNEQESIEKLCGLFEGVDIQKPVENSQGCPEFYAVRGSPTIYREFMKPFRLLVKGQAGNVSSYLVVKGVTGEGVLVFHREEELRLVTDEIISSHWGGEISWPYQDKENHEVCMGMFGTEVLEIQNLLINLGYSVYAHGYFDNITHAEIERLQRDFGLEVNGIVSRDTKALLSQLSG